MTGTFYGVLGVESDADPETINEGYRDRVTKVHPDVNDHPDADAQFQRLTTARDVLLDRVERARYDRLGHVSYVRQHVDCSAWTDAPRPVQSPSGGRAHPEDTDRTGDQSDGPAHPQPGRSTARPETDRDERESTESEDGATASGREATGAREGPSDPGNVSTGAETGATGPDQRTTASGECTTDFERGGDETESTAGSDTSRSWEEDTKTGPGSWDRARTRSPPGSFARGRFRETYSRGRGQLKATFHPLTLVRRVGSAVGVSPWGALHLAFLATAVATCLYASDVASAGTGLSAPLVLLLIGELGLGVILSSIQVFSRLTR